MFFFNLFHIIFSVEFALLLAEGGDSHEVQNAYNDEQLANLIDASLDKMDTTRDGYIDFVEYRAAHKELML